MNFFEFLSAVLAGLAVALFVDGEVVSGLAAMGAMFACIGIAASRRIERKGERP